MDKLIKILINNNIATYKLEKQRNEPIKIRYEYKNNNKVYNIFLYFFKWNDFINLYKAIPKENRHFYEIINNECKFFLDLDAKSDEIKKEKWDLYVEEIKNKLISIIYKLTKKHIEIIEFESLCNSNEKKYSSHLIVKNFKLTITQCDNLCKTIIKEIDIEKSRIIDNSIYNNWRSLRIQGCTKINSKRVKQLKLYKEQNIEIINIEGLITNLENTISFNTFDFNFMSDNRIITSINYKNIYQNKSIKNIKTYKYTNKDVDFIKSNYSKLELFINKWHNMNKNFITYKINNNIIMYRKILPYNCNICNRTHENQNPYIYMEVDEIYFNCRRTDKKIVKITHIYERYILDF